MTYIPKEYIPKDYSDLFGLSGFSEKLLQTHFALYQGYVKNTNIIAEKIAAFCGVEMTAEHAELLRRYAWEFNGMRLHELYFDQLSKKIVGGARAQATEKLAARWGTFEQWKEEFMTMGAMRGIGWVALVEDFTDGHLANIWITEHNAGLLANTKILLIMDVFEHAFIADYGLDRKAYIAAFFANLNWGVVEERMG